MNCNRSLVNGGTTSNNCNDCGGSLSNVACDDDDVVGWDCDDAYGP